MSVTNVLSFHEQATFDIVNNLGSLAARFIFRPIEDNSYFYFTQTITRNVNFKQQDKVRQFSMQGNISRLLIQNFQIEHGLSIKIFVKQIFKNNFFMHTHFQTYFSVRIYKKNCFAGKN